MTETQRGVGFCSIPPTHPSLHHSVHLKPCTLQTAEPFSGKWVEARFAHIHNPSSAPVCDDTAPEPATPASHTPPCRRCALFLRAGAGGYKLLAMTVLTDNHTPTPACHTAASSLVSRPLVDTTPRTRAPLFSVSRERGRKEQTKMRCTETSDGKHSATHDGCGWGRMKRRVVPRSVA